MSLRWAIYVCRTCGRQVDWPFCQHLKEARDRNSENMRTVIVRTQPSVEKAIRAEMEERQASA